MKACARFFVVVDDRAPCGPDARAALLASFGPRLAASRNLVKPPLDQGAGARAAVETFAAAVRGRGRSFGYSQLILSRIDLTLLTPLDALWGCAPGRICFAARCEEPAWSQYRCVSDLLFVVPRELLAWPRARSCAAR